MAPVGGRTRRGELPVRSADAVHAHDEQEVDAREVGGIDTELAGELSGGLIGAVGVQRRCEREALPQRAEDLDRFRTPEVHREMARELVREEERARRIVLADVVERLRPATQEHAAHAMRHEVEERGERGRLPRVRRLRRDEHRAVPLEDHPAERRGPGVEGRRREDLRDGHGDGRLPVPAPPSDGHVVVLGRERSLTDAIRARWLHPSRLALAEPAMSKETASEDPAPPVRASPPVIERSEAARHGDADASRVEREEQDDQARLAEEARALVERQAAELRAAKVPIETEPPTVYRP